MEKSTSQQEASISVVVPSYRTQDTLLISLLKKLEDVLCENFSEYEVIVVNDDAPSPEFPPIGEFTGNIKFISATKHLGKGGALKLGIDKAQGDFIAFIDADGELDPKALPKAFAAMMALNSDVVFAKRIPTEKGSRPFTRDIITFIYKITARLLLKVPFAETQAGFKLFKREQLKNIDLSDISNTTLFETEIIAAYIAAGNSRLSVVKVPYTVFRKTVINNRSALDTFYQMFKKRSLYKNSKAPKKPICYN